NHAARLQPFEFRRKLGLKVRAMRRLAADSPGLSRSFHQTLTQIVDGTKIRAHSLEHDLASNVHHVRVANLVMVHHRGHFPSRAQLTRLTLCGEDRYL